MGASALVLAVLGLAGTFLPQEILAAIGAPPLGLLTAIVQWLGALLVAFAMMNWMVKDGLVGGIYNRPVALGNLLHFAVGAITFVKALISGQIAGQRLLPFAIVTVVYVAFALAFAVVVFGSPVKGPATS
jgi:hypothetical protein